MIEHFSLVQQALAQLDHSAVQRAIDIIKAAKQRGSMIFICGNGGSAATASHFACDLQKAAGVRAIALTDNVPLITAWANDREYRDIFLEQLHRLSAHNFNSMLIVISCSGNSSNVKHIINYCHGLPIVGLFGSINNPLLDSGVTQSICVRSQDYGVIEDVHLSICHAITEGVASE